MYIIYAVPVVVVLASVVKTCARSAARRATARTARCSYADLLRAAVESGDWSAFHERLDDSAVLDSSSEAGRRRVEGADAIVRHLSAPGPGEVPVWDAQEWETGVAVTFEWHGESGADRRRWYVRADDSGKVTEIWSTAARPDEAGDDSIADRRRMPSWKELGAASQVTPLSHGGNSGPRCCAPREEARPSS